MNVPENCLWEDCMHIGPFKYPYAKYFLTKDTIYLNQGFINISSSQISLSKVATVKLTRNIFQRFFGIGTLEIYSIGDSQISIKLEGIEKSEKVQKLIMELLN